MAITQDNLNQDQDEFNAAFDGETPMTAEPTEDEAFGLDVAAAATQPPEAPMEGADEPAVVLAMADTDELEQAADTDQAKDSATSAAEAPKTGMHTDIDKETQRLKSWEGRLKAMQAKLDAAGASSSEQQTEAVSEAIETAADAADTPADSERVEQIAEHVEDGTMTAEQAMKQLSEDFGSDFVKMIEAIAVAKAQEAGSNAARESVGEVSKTVEEIINDIVDTKAKAHFETIASKHPDFSDIANSDGFAQWIEAMPEAEQAEAKRVATAGSAGEINQLLDGYKASMPAEQAAEPAADMAAGMAGDAGGEPMDLAGESEMDAAEGVRSTGMRLPQQPGAAEDDYLGAWNEA